MVGRRSRTGASSRGAGIARELAIELATGRTHQIRAHLASIGHPIAGADTLYAAAAGVHAPSAPRIALHACELRVRGLVYSAPPPQDFIDQREGIAAG